MLYLVILNEQVLPEEHATEDEARAAAERLAAALIDRGQPASWVIAPMPRPH